MRAQRNKTLSLASHKKMSTALSLLLVFVCFTSVLGKNSTNTTHRTNITHSTNSTPSTNTTSTPPSTNTTNTTKCWSNSTEIFNDLQASPPFKPNEYILCPNTTFTIGFRNSNGLCCVNGDVPLVARTNTVYKCGHNGSSANKCIFDGGEFQVQISPVGLSETTATGAEFHGITFRRPTTSTVLAAQSGDFTFVDCIFKVRAKERCVHVIRMVSFTLSNPNTCVFGSLFLILQY
jgi:hypothetical protein